MHGSVPDPWCKLRTSERGIAGGTGGQDQVRVAVDERHRRPAAIAQPDRRSRQCDGVAAKRQEEASAKADFTRVVEAGGIDVGTRDQIPCSRRGGNACIWNRSRIDLQLPRWRRGMDVELLDRDASRMDDIHIKEHHATNGATVVADERGRQRRLRQRNRAEQRAQGTRQCADEMSRDQRLQSVTGRITDDRHPYDQARGKGIEAPREIRCNY